jgi:hypothetical protein
MKVSTSFSSAPIEHGNAPPCGCPESSGGSFVFIFPSIGLWLRLCSGGGGGSGGGTITDECTSVSPKYSPPELE